MVCKDVMCMIVSMHSSEQESRHAHNGLCDKYNWHISIYTNIITYFWAPCALFYFIRQIIRCRLNFNIREIFDYLYNQKIAKDFNSYI